MLVDDETDLRLSAGKQFRSVIKCPVGECLKSFVKGKELIT